MNTSPSPAVSSADLNDIRAWFAGSVPDGWFVEPVSVTGDRDEVLVLGTLAVPQQAEDADEAAREAAALARIARFREDTRGERIRIAGAAEQRFGRKVSWGAKVGETQGHFSTLSLPVMTRLRLEERQVLDTLIDAGVARSRAEALAWCVKLVGRNEQARIDGLREALQAVEKARAQGPSVC